MDAFEEGLYIWLVGTGCLINVVTCSGIYSYYPAFVCIQTCEHYDLNVERSDKYTT